MPPVVRKMQERLIDMGYQPGPLDGLVGPKTASAFQEMLAGMGFRFQVSTEPGQIVLRGPVPERTKANHPLPWMAEGFGALGLHETRDNADLTAFLASDGSALGDPARFPWCGDFVHTCIQLALPGEPFPGRVGQNPYLARNWLDFGIECGPTVGAVVVAHRGDPDSIYGHVAFYLGEDDKFVYLLGGNQRNAVTANTRIAKSRVLGYRWPSTSPFKPGGPRYIEDADAITSFNEA